VQQDARPLFAEGGRSFRTRKPGPSMSTSSDRLSPSVRSRRYSEPQEAGHDEPPGHRGIRVVGPCAPPDPGPSALGFNLKNAILLT
jgi:hypothetical protein